MLRPLRTGTPAHMQREWQEFSREAALEYVPHLARLRQTCWELHGGESTCRRSSTRHRLALLVNRKTTACAVRKALHCQPDFCPHFYKTRGSYYHRLVVNPLETCPQTFLVYRQPWSTPRAWGCEEGESVHTEGNHSGFRTLTPASRERWRLPTLTEA